MSKNRLKAGGTVGPSRSWSALLIFVTWHKHFRDIARQASFNRFLEIAKNIPETVHRNPLVVHEFIEFFF
jgi:hypothetical protein